MLILIIFSSVITFYYDGTCSYDGWKLSLRFIYFIYKMQKILKIQEDFYENNGLLISS